MPHFRKISIRKRILFSYGIFFTPIFAAMTPFLNFLADKKLPGWAMLHNARLSYHPREGHRVSHFDEVFWSESIEELRAKIGTPVLLNNREAREMAMYRFGEEELKAGNFRFDDMPGALTSESSDMEIFGESWVIFWVCPPDLDFITHYLLDKLEAEAGERIEAQQIKEVWDDYLHRIFFFHKGEGDMVELTLLYDSVQDTLMEQINASEKAPAESAWEILDEDSLLGGDDDW